MLVGLLSPSGGTARVLGCELPRDCERLRPRIGYMTQRFSLYEDLTVEENLDFAAEIFGFHGESRRHRVEETLAAFELGERRGERSATLSGGWKQRLALAAATIHRPELLVLDEPTAGVDPARRRAFWEEIFEIAAAGATVLVSTHYMDEAVRCHRLCMLIRGRAVAIGEPDTLTADLEDRVVEVSGEHAGKAIGALRTLPEVASTTQLGNHVHVLLGRDAGSAAAVAPTLARRLRAVGLGGLDARPTDPTLEDVFVDLRTRETAATAE